MQPQRAQSQQQTNVQEVLLGSQDRVLTVNVTGPAGERAPNITVINNMNIENLTVMNNSAGPSDRWQSTVRRPATDGVHVTNLDLPAAFEHAPVDSRNAAADKGVGSYRYALNQAAIGTEALDDTNEASLDMRNELDYSNNRIA